jgi:hypothetical protein
MPMNTSRVNVGANTFPPERDYSLLTLKDLLEARDHYHVHLAHLPNVVATAVGRYLIYENDPTAHHRPQTTKGRPSERASRQPRTLFNSVVKEWSWPCVLVFVDKWLSRRQFAKHPDCMVPRALYLPDGRVVPTCTVLVHEAEEPSCPDYHLSFANSFLGGGYLTFSDVQGEEHIGSIGCLVSDGDLTYALTNRHVTGSAGREMFTIFSGKRRRIGVSDRNHLTLKNFTDMYPTWPGKNVKVHLDAGLIRIDDKRDWTTQVAGMGPLAEWIDISTDTLTLDIIDSRLRAFGAASGELRGRIAALFYRYSTAGGTDYVTEFLIRPESLADQGTQHGDSGTLWFFEERKHPASPHPDSLRPCAMQWGGHVWVNGRSCQRVGRFALATCLSTVCRELNVTLLRDWNTGLPEYWGPVGHYTIGFFACQGIGGKLGTLMKANQTTVSYPLDSISSRTKINAKGPSGLVPLADVPDRLWAHGKTLRGGADKPNHFADMDKPDPKKGNKTLLQLCAEDPGRVNPDFWLEYYADIGDTGRGLLPFRVWQFFDEMVDAVKKHDATRFVAAAGILAHYVGDACQPLHCSFLHHGDRPGLTDSSGDDVHTAYEESMLRKNAVEFLTMMTNAAANPGPQITAPASGQEAAQATVALMQRTFKTISPREIVDAFNDSKELWPLFGVRTVKVMGDGIRTLQAIWRGAWKQGGGDTSIVEAKLKAAPPTDLIALYMRKTWMPSKTLKTIGSVLK